MINNSQLIVGFSDRLSCLQVLNIMVILGFMLNYMLRVNLTIAIVSMVMPSNKHSHSNNSHEIIPIDNSSLMIETAKTTMLTGNEPINESTFTSTSTTRHVRYFLDFFCYDIFFYFKERNLRVYKRTKKKRSIDSFHRRSWSKPGIRGTNMRSI